jgi:hypothetical protein
MADPVTFTYQINVRERCSDLVNCAPFSSSFPLMLTFDSRFTTFETPEFKVQHFGAPTFSAIPLARPDIPPGATFFPGVTRGTAFRVHNGWTFFAEATTFTQLRTSDRNFVWETRLEAGSAFFPPDGLPGFSANSLAEFLGRGMSPLGFLYRLIESDRVCCGGPFPGGSTVAYPGTAVLLASDVPPVPEPMSMLLVGSGLCGLGARAWQRRRRLETKQRRVGSCQIE